MTTISELLQPLRAQRRRTVAALHELDEAQLIAHVGPGRPADVRFMLLVLAQDDDRRCASLGAILDALEWRLTEGKRILASLGLTRGSLRAALAGLSPDDLDRAPAPGEWTVRQAMRHIVNNERKLLADAAYATQRLHSTEPLPLEPPGASQPPGSLGPELLGGIDQVLRALDEVRDQVAALAAGWSAEELGAPMRWAGTEVDLRFMVHRRATHERQHTVQIRKTLQAIDRPQSEAQMLLGQAEIARGALEGTALGVPDDLVDRAPGNGLPSIMELLAEAEADEAAKVAAILGALS